MAGVGCLPPFPPPTTALELFATQRQFLSYGCKEMDKRLGNGLRLGCGVHEFAGRASTGKTQLCMQLAAMATVPTECGGLGGKAYYIYTDGDFPLPRFEQIGEGVCKRCAAAGSVVTCKSIKERLFIQCVSTIEELWDAVANKLPIFASQQNLKLVVVDSMASLFRSEFEADEGMQRSRLLFEMGAIFKQLSGEHNLAVVVTNQVTSNISEDHLQPETVRPSLGLSWSSCVTNRFRVFRTNTMVGCDQLERAAGREQGQADQPQQERSVCVRGASVMLSPYLPAGRAVQFVVVEQGVVGLPRAGGL